MKVIADAIKMVVSNIDNKAIIEKVKSNILGLCKENPLYSSINI